MFRRVFFIIAFALLAISSQSIGAAAKEIPRSNGRDLQLGRDRDRKGPFGRALERKIRRNLLKAIVQSAKSTLAFLEDPTVAAKLSPEQSGQLVEVRQTLGSWSDDAPVPQQTEELKGIIGLLITFLTALGVDPQIITLLSALQGILNVFDILKPLAPTPKAPVAAPTKTVVKAQKKGNDGPEDGPPKV